MTTEAASILLRLIPRHHSHLLTVDQSYSNLTERRERERERESETDREREMEGGRERKRMHIKTKRSPRHLNRGFPLPHIYLPTGGQLILIKPKNY
ncbi:hypothetical protein AOLI_G00093640 [Acnodon oligacanthus]